jgi:hypothetical protein
MHDRNPNRNPYWVCDTCQQALATVYAMGRGSGDWGGRFCDQHIPSGFIVTDRYPTEQDID